MSDRAVPAAVGSHVDHGNGFAVGGFNVDGTEHGIGGDFVALVIPMPMTASFVGIAALLGVFGKYYFSFVVFPLTRLGSIN